MSRNFIQLVLFVCHIDVVVDWNFFQSLSHSSLSLYNQPVEDRADVGSYWSGFPDIYGQSDMKRPRRIDASEFSLFERQSSLSMNRIAS